MEIILSYPAWFLLFCVLTGAAFAFALYYRDRKTREWKKWLRNTLAVCRFVLITLLAFFLLSPLVKYLFVNIEKPIVVLATDNSSSVLLNKDSLFYRQEFPSKLEALYEKLSKDYEVYHYRFAESSDDQLAPDYSGKETDMSSILEEIQVKFTNQNLGGVVVLSDGLYNKGKNPVYLSETFPSAIYTVALGDTTVRKDVLITKAVYNNVVFLGNKFPIEVLVRGRKVNGSKVTLTLNGPDGKVGEKVISFDSEDELEVSGFILEATTPGITRYRAVVSRVDGEITYVNNSLDIFVEVIDSRQKILILNEAPHPDIGTISQVIYGNKNYQAVTQDIAKFDGNVKEYSLVIFYQLPSFSNNLGSVMPAIKESNIPALFIMGNASNLAGFNQIGTGFKISGNRGNTDEVLPSINPDFTLFTMDENARSMISKFPPLISPFGTYESSPQSSALLFRKVGSVSTTAPLIVFQSQEKWKTGVIAGEGIWKWRIFDYKTNKTHQVFDDLFSKIIQYLAVKEDKSYFRVNVPSEFPENEPVIMDAELYNQSYELINTPEVKIDIFNAEKKKFPYTFSAKNNAYSLDAGKLSPGDYTYQASVNFEGKTYSKSGMFTVKPLQVEAVNTVADHALMYSLARRTGGEMVTVEEMDKIVDLIKSNDKIKPRSDSRKELKDLIHFRWIFFILLALVSIEWFVRKREGTY